MRILRKKEFREIYTSKKYAENSNRTQVVARELS